MTAIGDHTRRSFLTGRFHQPRPPAIAIGDGCFARQNVVCQSCADVCTPRAIRFRPQIGKPPLPELIADECTLCGACASACPASAIILTTSTRGRTDE
jgi:ferredoxin-type protein NapF